jgi:PAS domain S-box-containing protein
MQLIRNALLEGVYGSDEDGNATFCNQSLLRMTGYEADEVVGKDLHTLLHHSYSDGTRYPLEKCQAISPDILHFPARVLVR